jgi:hypothetical protein
MITILMCVGLVLTNVDPFYESLFFAGVISYLMIFLLMLIRDLDNPFGYYEAWSSADVTLQPLDDTVGRLAKLAETVAGPRVVAAAVQAAQPAPTVAAAVAAPTVPAPAPTVAAPAPAPAPIVPVQPVASEPRPDPKSKKKTKSKSKRG